MVYVSRALSIRSAIAYSKEHIHKNTHKIKTVCTNQMPIWVEHRNGDRYLFMSTEYYEKHYKLGRRKGIDYITIWVIKRNLNNN